MYIFCMLGANKLYLGSCLLLARPPNHFSSWPSHPLYKHLPWQTQVYRHKTNRSILKRLSLFKDAAGGLYERLLRKRKHLIYFFHRISWVGGKLPSLPEHQNFSWKWANLSISSIGLFGRRQRKLGQSQSVMRLWDFLPQCYYFGTSHKQ